MTNERFSILDAVEKDRNKTYDELFTGLGDFCQQVKVATSGAGLNRMKMAVSVAANEGAGADGGFAVPPGIAGEIVATIKEFSLAALCDAGETESRALVTPVVGGAPWNDSAGIVCGWGEELAQINPSKLSLEGHSQVLNKLTALVPVSAELLDDAVGLDRFMKREVTRKLASVLNRAIIAGNGVGRPLGVLNAPCTISVAKEESQAADTITGANLLAMHGRWHSEPRNGAWLVNKTAEGALIAAAGGAGLYGPGHTVAGLPVIPCAACSVLGDQGDVLLADLSQYSIVLKAGGLRLDVSMHLWMDYDVVAFRFVLRVTGQPWWSAAADPLHGSDTLSPFVVLAERA